MDQGLKQRIIGASVLVVAAVIFLPMLLSGQDETVQVEVAVPPAPVLDKRDIVTATPQPLPVPQPVAEIPQPAAPQRSERSVPEPVVAESPPAATVPAPAPAPVAPQPVADGGWVIQQASFSSAANAENFRATLIKQGYNAYTRAAQSGGKPIVRVYVGPVASREAANQVRDELARRYDGKGQVVAHDGNTRAL